MMSESSKILVRWRWDRRASLEPLELSIGSLQRRGNPFRAMMMVVVMTREKNYNEYRPQWDTR